MSKSWRIIPGDVLDGLKTIPDASIHTCVTSPPYWNLRDYGNSKQIGLEPTPLKYVERMTEVFAEVRRVLRDDGTLWLNLGDTYANSGVKSYNLKAKDLVGIPWRVAFALQDAGWYLRQDIIWHKPCPMPNSVNDRCTTAHEYVFMLAKSERYHYDAMAIAEDAVTAGQKRTITAKCLSASFAVSMGKKLTGNTKLGAVVETGSTRNKRSVWTISTKPLKDAHFAAMPWDLAHLCVLAGCPDRCCATCGTGYRRIVDKQRIATRPGNLTKVTGDIMTDGNRDPLRHVTHKQTVGHEPACQCPQISPTIPGVVLDPFAGSGTTLMVAEKLLRRSVGIELNDEYIKLANKRIGEINPLFG